MKRRLLRHFEPLGLLLVGLLLRALTLPLPTALRPRGDGETAGQTGVRYTDAAGVVLREVRDASGTRSRRLAPEAAHSLLADALIEAEDRRFRGHLGIDPIGVARAAWHDLWPGHRLQGASTLTMQLARAVAPHPRTLRGKLEEMALALRIEASLSKDEILLAYLSEAPFGPQLRGAEVAAEQLFGKPTSALSPAEAATLAALPKAPGHYLTQRGRGRLQARRDDLLQRLHARGRLDAVTLARALVEPLPERLRGAGLIAPHLVEAVRGGRLGPVPAGDTVRLALSLPLQARVEAAVRAQVDALRERHVGAGAAVVLDNETGAILAYVGSADFQADDGQNDGVLALRQPGSSLKPFVYALAMQAQRIDAASVLPDLPIRLEGEDGVFSPRNYDGVFHGPVRAREALGNSYNVPAVWLADRLGVGTVLEGLRRIGFTSLRESASHYGAALALGDGEVRLLELAEAYATLAREGIALHATPLLEPAGADGSARATRRVLDADVARLVTHMLADRRARASAFGEHSVLEFPYAVAAKTGTSKGFRDNVTAGYTHEITVVTWVGNFDGSPMQDVSGIAGAGPMFHAVMEQAMQGRTARPFDPPGGRYEEQAVCPLSGRRAGASCPHRVQEWVPVGHETRGECMMHEMVGVAPDGLRAGAHCAGSALHPFERYDETFASWARTARRPLAPESFSPACPGSLPTGPTGAPLRIVMPRDGARYQLDPGRSAESQALFVEVHGTPSRVRLDGRVVPREGGGFSLPLRIGSHELVVEDTSGSTASARYEVR